MKRMLLVSLLMVFASAHVEGGIWDKIKNVFVTQEKSTPPKIRVLIAHDVDEALLEVRGKYHVYDPYKEERLAVRFLGKSQHIQAMSSGLRWGEEFPGVYQLHIIPDSKETLTMIDGTPYKGTIYIYDVSGKISIVNEVDIEDFLHATLPRKLDRPLSDEGLSAMIIASRTDAYYQAYSGRNPFWHVDGRTMDYRGDTYAHTNPILAEAIANTRFMVMSKTGIYEGVLTPFPIELVDSGCYQGEMHNALSIEEIEAIAAKGDNAARILTRFFPNASLELAHRDRHVEQLAEVKIKEFQSPRAR